MTEREYRIRLMEREYLRELKVKGKSHLLKQELLSNLVLWFVIMVGTGWVDSPHLKTLAHYFLFPGSVMLPIFLLYGYLNAGWRWKDLSRKFPD